MRVRRRCERTQLAGRVWAGAGGSRVTLRKTNVFQTGWRAGGELWPDGVACGACLREYLEIVQAFLPDLVRQAYGLRLY